MNGRNGFRLIAGVVLVLLLAVAGAGLYQAGISQGVAQTAVEAGGTAAPAVAPYAHSGFHPFGFRLRDLRVPAFPLLPVPDLPPDRRRGLGRTTRRILGRRPLGPSRLRTRLRPRWAWRFPWQPLGGPGSRGPRRVAPTPGRRVRRAERRLDERRRLERRGFRWRIPNRKLLEPQLRAVDQSRLKPSRVGPRSWPSNRGGGLPRATADLDPRSSNPQPPCGRAPVLPGRTNRPNAPDRPDNPTGLLPAEEHSRRTTSEITSEQCPHGPSGPRGRRRFNGLVAPRRTRLRREEGDLGGRP